MIRRADLGEINAFFQAQPQSDFEFEWKDCYGGSGVVQADDRTVYFGITDNACSAVHTLTIEAAVKLGNALIEAARVAASPCPGDDDE